MTFLAESRRKAGNNRNKVSENLPEFYEKWRRGNVAWLFQPLNGISNVKASLQASRLSYISKVVNRVREEKACFWLLVTRTLFSSVRTCLRCSM